MSKHTDKKIRYGDILKKKLNITDEDEQSDEDRQILSEIKLTRKQSMALQRSIDRLQDRTIEDVVRILKELGEEK